MALADAEAEDDGQRPLSSDEGERRSLAGGGLYIETTSYYPGNPIHMDFKNNYWGTKDTDEISQWIIDRHDNDQVSIFIDFDPVADAPVPVESRSWSAVKKKFE